MNEPLFTLQWEGQAEPSAPIGLGDLLADNAGDPELCDWLKRAPVGGSLTTGGGAAPACALRRVL